MSHPVCKSCGINACAPNYIKEGTQHYRSRCNSCIKRNKTKQVAWQRAGYKKKMLCEKCGFKAKQQAQMFVWHIDGNRRNVTPTNLKSVCANCNVELAVTRSVWKQGDLIPDF
jgi:predicted 2-oxoglutarate/Fe(II)-dependent dioxygenase YbiX